MDMVKEISRQNFEYEELVTRTIIPSKLSLNTFEYTSHAIGNYAYLYIFKTDF